MLTLESKARAFAKEKHAGQRRKFGQRQYIYHPACVVKYLKGKDYIDQNLLAAGWCHDLVEDCDISYLQLECLFGLDVSRLVQEVSHPAGAIGLKPRSIRWQAYLEHYSNASLEGKVLKLADRICNLQEYIDYWDELDDKGKRFLENVYLDESNDLLEALILDRRINLEITKDLVHTMNWIDELLSEREY